MSFEYTSLTSPEFINKFKRLIHNRFKYYDPTTRHYFYTTLSAGYEACICVDISHKYLIYNNYDHPLDCPDTDYTVARLDDKPENIIDAWIKLVKLHDLDNKNYHRERQIYEIQHSDIVAYD